MSLGGAFIAQASLRRRRLRHFTDFWPSVPVRDEYGVISETNDRCAACGNQLRARARYCDECGSPVAAAAAERKQVTVLFADVVDSMRLAATLDSERLQEMMNELFNRAAAVVQRYQGTVDKFTGDGLMALFGAPLALEDHAVRACVAALEIQSVSQRFAGEVLRRDGVSLRLRIGLNSGEVIAGRIGAGPGRYTAIGHPVGIAERMEAAAAADAVLCSMTTAHLAELGVRLGPVEWVAAKGVDELVPARRLLAMRSDQRIVGRNEGTMLGRDLELRCLKTCFDAGRGRLVSVMGAPGLGKSRLIAEFTALVEADAAVVTARCEAHTTGHSFRALSRLLRALFGVNGLADADARARTAAQLPGLAADSADAQILFEAMGIADSTAGALQDNVDGRRRRLVEVMARALLERPCRTVLVLEDVHWIDAPSDAVLAEWAETQSAAMLVVTFRPEYSGALRRAADDAVALQPLDNSVMHRLATQLLGQTPAAKHLAEQVTTTSAGNPFFLEEIVRDLADRDILSGSRGNYRLTGDLSEITVPATVQAVLAARIDRLPPEAKKVLNVAAVVGTRFDLDALTALLTEPVEAPLAELVSAELIDQTDFVPQQRYCFRHPLVRTVAYDSQLSTTRAHIHREVAAAIRARNPRAVDENAAQIATHLEAAGELFDAYHWHERAADWLRPRDLPAARTHWARAEDIADRLPEDQPGVTAMRIAPRTMLLSTLLYVGADPSADERYRRLQQLTRIAGDPTSLAIAMAGRIWAFALNDHRVPEAAALATEIDQMLDDLACDARTMGVILNAVAYARFAECDFRAALAALDTLDDLPEPVPMVELAPALAMRGVIEGLLGDPDTSVRRLRESGEQVRALPPVNYASVLALRGFLVVLGMCEVDDMVDDMREAVRRAEEFGDLLGMVAAHFGYGAVGLRSARVPRSDAVAALHKAAGAVEAHGVSILMGTAVVTDLAREAVGTDDADDAIERIRGLIADGGTGASPLLAGLPVETLVELLTHRGSAGDLAEAHRLVAQWGARRVGIPAVDLWWLRAYALVTRADGDMPGFAEAARRYLMCCEELGAQGRIADARRLVVDAEPTYRS